MALLARAGPSLRHPAQSALAPRAPDLSLSLSLSSPPSLRLFADPFADAIKGSDDDVQDGLVHIRIQQRNGRKTLTTVQGLSSEYDLKKIVRACKKVSVPTLTLLPRHNVWKRGGGVPPDPFSCPLCRGLGLHHHHASSSLSAFSPTTGRSGRTLKIGLMQTTMTIQAGQM